MGVDYAIVYRLINFVGVDYAIVYRLINFVGVDYAIVYRLINFVDVDYATVYRLINFWHYAKKTILPCHIENTIVTQLWLAHVHHKLICSNWYVRICKGRHQQFALLNVCACCKTKISRSFTFSFKVLLPLFLALLQCHKKKSGS